MAAPSSRRQIGFHKKKYFIKFLLQKMHSATTIFFLICFVWAASTDAAKFDDDIDAFVEVYEQKREAKIRQTVRKCCPQQLNADNIRQPLHCCQADLFPSAKAQSEARHNGWPPLRECSQEGLMDEEEIGTTVRCAQQDFHGHRAADICRVQCCSLFENLDPPNSTACSRHCAAAMKMVDMTRQKLVHGLRKMQCHRLGQLQDQAFQHCIKPIGTGDGELEGPAVDIAEGAPPCSETAEFHFGQ